MLTVFFSFAFMQEACILCQSLNFVAYTVIEYLTFYSFNHSTIKASLLNSGDQETLA